MCASGALERDHHIVIYLVLFPEYTYRTQYEKSRLTYLLTKWFIVLHFAAKNEKLKKAIKMKKIISSPYTTVIKFDKILTIV